MGKFISISQHNRIVAEIAAERDKAIRERIMAERNNDILDRIREAKRGPLENYVGHVLDDAAAEIESLRSRQTCVSGTEATVACRLRVYRETQAASPYLKRLLNDAEAAISSLAVEADSLLLAIGLDPDTYRTECGNLNIPKIAAAIKHPSMYPGMPNDCRNTSSD